MPVIVPEQPTAHSPCTLLHLWLSLCYVPCTCVLACTPSRHLSGPLLLITAAAGEATPPAVGKLCELLRVPPPDVARRRVLCMLQPMLLCVPLLSCGSCVKAPCTAPSPAFGFLLLLHPAPVLSLRVP